MALMISTIVFTLSFTDLISKYKMVVRISCLVFTLRAIHFFIPAKLKSERKTALLSKYVLAYAIVNTLSGISLLFVFSINGLLTGMAFANICLLWYLHQREEISLKAQIDLMKIKRLTLIGLPIMVLRSSRHLMHYIDKIIVFFMLGSTMNGYYGLATFLSIIVNYIPYTLSAVLFPRMMYKYGKTKKKLQIEDYLSRPLLLISNLLPIFIGIIYINIDLPITYFLPKYIPSIQVLKILVLGFFFSVIWSIPFDLLITLGKQNRVMFINICILITGATLDILTIKSGLGILGVAFATVITFFCASFITYCYAQISLKKNRKEIIFAVIKLYSPFIYTVCGLLLVSLISSANSILNNGLRSIFFTVYCFPLLVYAHKKSGIIYKTIFSFRENNL
jgi:O-antigen/teichoic acid export membrane protein